MQGGGSGGRGSSGRADRPLVICGSGTLSLPWTHLSSRAVGKKRGGDGGNGEGEGAVLVVGLQGRKWFTMTPIFKHFHPWP